MKIPLTFAFLALSLLTFSKAETPSAPPEEVESSENLSMTKIENEARSLLEAREFDKLDQMAGSMRISKAMFPNGRWELRCFYSGLSKSLSGKPDDIWRNHLDKLREWVRQKPESITARIGLADCLVDYAWEARGSGYADTVKASGWKDMAARLTQSRETLEEARKLESKCPHWYFINQNIALGQQWYRQDYESLYNEAIQNEPQYYSFHFGKVYFLFPRWYGKEGEFEKFAEEISNKTGGEEGDILYARIVWYLDSSNFFDNVFKNTQMKWPRTKAGFQALMKKYPDSFWVTSEYCSLASQGQDGATVKELFSKTIKNRMDKKIWGSSRRFVIIRDWALKP